MGWTLSFHPLNYRRGTSAQSNFDRLGSTTSVRLTGFDGMVSPLNELEIELVQRVVRTDSFRSVTPRQTSLLRKAGKRTDEKKPASSAKFRRPRL